jgi:hypothetical protein
MRAGYNFNPCVVHRAKNLAPCSLCYPRANSVYRPKYAKLLNKSCDEVIGFARSHRDMFVFPFITLPVGECGDYNALKEVDDLPHIAPPIYVGNLKPMDSAIRQIMENTLGLELSECEEVSSC